MILLERLHGSYVYPRRIARLSEELARLIPAQARVLDVGSGDGALAAELVRIRPDLEIEGVDVLIRPDPAIPTSPFDGETLPHADGSVDVSMLVDVVHHAAEPVRLLAEASRVAHRAVVIKDHLLEGRFAARTLRFMDRTGNVRHDIALPYGYWPRERWHEVFAELELEPTTWTERLAIYPWPARLVFDRSLHFMAQLERRT